MGQKICLETDFLVNFLRGKEEAHEYIEKKEETHNLATTTINAFELYHGAYKSQKSEQNVNQTEELLNRLTILELSLKSAREAGKNLAELESQGDKIDFRDLLIGTIAKRNGYPIKTGNKKHFKRVPELEILE